MSPPAGTVVVGDSLALSASVTVQNGAAQTVTWTTSDATRATVRATGGGSAMVTGIAPGPVTITAVSTADASRSGASTLTIATRPPSTVALSATAVAVRVGDSTTVTATPRDAQGNALTGRTVAWQTSNAAVATATPVAGTGDVRVKGIAAGTATLTATVDGVPATATITVTAAPITQGVTTWGAPQRVQPFPLIGDPTATYLGVRAIWGSGAASFLAVTDYGQIWRWTGGAWTAVRAGNAYFGLHGASATEVYAVGDGVISRFDGTTWADAGNVPAVELHAVWASSGLAFAVGDRGTILRSTGGNVWTAMPSGTTASLNAVWGNGTTAFAVGDDGVVLRYTGTATAGEWTPLAAPTTGALSGVWGTSPTDLYVLDVDDDHVLHYDGATFATVALVDAPHAVFGTGASDVTVVGYGVVEHYDGARWTATPTSQTVELYAGWSVGGTTLVGGDRGYTAVQSATGAAWRTLTFHAAWADVWVGSSSFAMAVGPGEQALRWNGTAWSPVPTGTPFELSNVWGFGPSSLYATSFEGAIFRYDGSAWSTMTSPAAYLDGIWGSASNDLYAVGDAIYHYDGTAWTRMAGAAGLDRYYLYAISGSAPNDVVAVGDWYAVQRWDGTRWNAVGTLPGTYPGFFLSVWVVDASTAFIGADDGTIFRLSAANTLTSLGRQSDCAITGLWATRATDVYAITGCGEVLRYDGTTWRVQTTSPDDALYGIHGLANGGGAWVGGTGGVLLHGTGGAPTAGVLAARSRARRLVAPPAPRPDRRSGPRPIGPARPATVPNA